MGRGLAPDHADAVTEPMREVRAVTRGGDDGACGAIDVLRGDAGLHLRDRGGLRVVDQVVDFTEAIGGRAEPAGAGDVRLVALKTAAAVDEDDGIFGETCFAGRSVRERRVRADLNERSAFDAASRVLFLDDAGDVALGHS